MGELTAFDSNSWCVAKSEALIVMSNSDEENP